MVIMLGNLTTKQIEERLGIELPEEERKTLNACRQENASGIAKDKWHCFDIPFSIVCGSKETAIKIRDILQPYSSKMKEQIKILLIKGKTIEEIKQKAFSEGDKRGWERKKCWSEQID